MGAKFSTCTAIMMMHSLAPLVTSIGFMALSLKTRAQSPIVARENEVYYDNVLDNY